jgi:proteasomal ATPase-associated factor 1
MPSPVTLPTATIQDDFTTVLSEVHAGIIPSDNIWLSCYKDGEPSIHGKISVSLHEQDRDRVELVGRGGVELTRTSQVSFFFSGNLLIRRRRSFRSSADFEPGAAAAPY